MYNIKAAVSRLPFAPKPKKMEVTDIRTGHFVFPPKEDVPASFGSLEEAITGAGYEIERAWIEVTGELTPDGRLRAGGSGQVFDLAGGETLDELRSGAEPGTRMTVFGEWLAGEGRDTLVVERWTRGEVPPQAPGMSGGR